MAPRSELERMVFDDRTQMNADNPDLKDKELTDELIRFFYRVYINGVFWKRFMRLQ